MPKKIDLSPFDKHADKSSKLDLSPFDSAVPQQPELPNDVGMGEAALRGAGQGLSLGFGDEIVGGVKAAGSKLTGNGKSLEDLYNQYRDIERQRNEAASQRYPKTYTGTEIAGGIGTMLIPGVGEAAMTGKGAAILGALNGLGNSKADLTKGEVGQAAIDTGIGAALGKGGQMLGSALAPVAKEAAPAIQSAGEAVERKAGDMGLSALGMPKATIKQELGKPLGTFVDPSYRKGIGQAALDNAGVFQGPEAFRNQINDTFFKILEQKKPLISKATDMLKDKIEKKAITAEEAEILGKNAVSTKLEEGSQNLMKNLQKTETNSERLSNIEKDLNGYVARVSKSDMDIAQLEDFKQAIGRDIGKSFKKSAHQSTVEDPVMTEFKRNVVYPALKNRIEELSNFVQPNLGDKIKMLNQEESKLISLGESAFESQASDIANKSPSMGFGDALTAGAGATFGGPVGAVLSVAGKRGAEAAMGKTLGEAGGLAAAKLTRAAGKGMQSAAQSIEENPESINKVITPLMTNPATQGSVSDRMSQMQAQHKDEHAAYPTYTLSKDLYKASQGDLHVLADQLNQAGHMSMGNALADALNKGDVQKKNAILFNLIQDPKYRRVIRDDAESEGK